MAGGDAFWHPLPGGSGGGAGSVVSVDDPVVFSDHHGADLGYDAEFDAIGTTLPSGWAWVNQGSATFALRAGAGVIAVPANTGDSIRALVRDLPSEATWDIKAKVSAPITTADFQGYGLVLVDTTNSRLMFHQATTQSGQVDTNRWSSFTATAAGAGTASARGYVQYVRIRKNSATSYDFGWSVDGVAWRWNATAFNVSTHMTINKMGFAGNTNGAGAFDVACHWFRVR